MSKTNGLNGVNDPVGERLRSYYQSIQTPTPARLEARVSHAMDAAPAMRPTRGFFKPAFNLTAVGAVLVIVALIARNLGPAPVASPSAVTGRSSSPSPSATAGPTLPPTPTLLPTPTFTPPSGTPSPGPSPTARPVGSLQAAGRMNPALSGPVAVRLSDGRVLITGGREKRSNGITLLRSQTAEIYTPGGFAPTGSMADARAGHTATLLRDGRVLVVGGIDASDGFDNLATAELYNPASGTFTRTGSLMQGRAHHTATLLDDGRVLIAGGYGGGTLSLKSAEIYDPATGKFTPTGSMTLARRDARAELLSNGLVLIAGGLDQNATSALASAEQYDPATGKFTPTGGMGTARALFAMTWLEDGRELLAGGLDGAGHPLKTAEFYDPRTGEFSPAGSTSAAGASMGVWLKDARLLFASSAAVSIYDPASARFSAVGAPSAPIDTATWTLSGVLLTEGGLAQVWQP
jgi:hypothetical protein